VSSWWREKRVKIVSQSHVTDAEIEHAIRGDLEAAEVHRIAVHLTRCPSCRHLKRPRLTWLGAMLSGAEAAPEALDPVTEAAYDRALDRALAKAAKQVPRWRKHQEHTATLFTAQQKLPPFRMDGNHLLWPDGEDAGAPRGAILDALLALSYDMRYRDPMAMKDLAEAAVRVAKSLRQKDYTLTQIVDMHVRTLGELANACRLNDELKEADELITDALGYLDAEGSGDPMIRTRLYDLRASLRLDQRRLGEALDLLDEVHERYKELGEKHLAGRALISKGSATFYDGRPREAAGLLKKGLALIDPARDPRLDTTGYYNLLDALVEVGDFKEAGTVLLKSGLRQDFAEDPLNLLKLRCLEGKIFAGAGKLQRAESAFLEVKMGFSERGRDLDAVAAGLHLAAVYLRQMKTAPAEELVVEALETFLDLNVAYEARKAVGYLRQAFRQNVASANMVQTILHFLRKLERDPALSFEPF
jgi:tetratricopeptide (TPR) repeat protein